MGFIRNLYRAKWCLLRLSIAVFLCSVIAGDTAARFARLELAALPNFDFAAEVKALRTQGRYGEAVMIAETGLADDPGNAAIQAEKDATVAERDSWTRKALSAGKGAISGRGESLESLIGAVAADFFIVGDIRDLVIEGGKEVVDGDGDPLVILLSFVGLVTTLAPEIDWAPAILKAARRAGHVTTGFAEHLKTLLIGHKTKEVVMICEDVARISKKASPGAAMRMLRLADSPEDLARLGRFVERNPAGAFALHITGKEGSLVLKGAESAGAAGAKAAEELVIAVSKKGNAGIRFLASPAARALTKPHALIGLAKGLWKGNAERLITRALDRLDPNAWWALPLAAAWAVLELLLLARIIFHRAKATA